MAASRPHVIYILSDEHNGMAMSHMGDPNVQTPTMDRLAAEGVSFRRAYANCPICTPSRGSIFSGRHAHAQKQRKKDRRPPAPEHACDPRANAHHHQSPRPK